MNCHALPIVGKFNQLQSCRYYFIFSICNDVVGVRDLFRGVGEDGGALDVNAKLAGALQYGAGQTWFQFLGTEAEVGFGGAYVCRVGHRIFAALGQSEY